MGTLAAADISFMETTARLAAHKPSANLRRPRLVPIAAAAGAAVAYAAMRVPSALTVHRAFAERCTRFAMRPRDWPCRTTSAKTLLVYIGASLLAGLALALPAAVLAASGRRCSFGAIFIAPVAIPVLWAFGATSAAGVTGSDPASAAVLPLPYLGVHAWQIAWSSDGSFWATHPALSAGADVALLALPAALIAWRGRGRSGPPGRWRPTASGWIAAAITLSASTAAVAATWPMHLLSSGDLFFDAVERPLAVGFVEMFVFGLLLGRDRRWWPWIFAPAALLLSLGPWSALQASLFRLQDFVGFGAVLPLAAVGLVAAETGGVQRRVQGRLEVRAARAAARAQRLDEFVDGDPDFDLDAEDLVDIAINERDRAIVPTETPDAGGPDAGGPDPAARRPPRPSPVAIGIAAGAIAVATIMFAFDPGAAQFSAAIPTYLGERVAAADYRARLNLSEALRASDEYRVGHGSLAGFDAAAGRELVPSLTWADGSFATTPTPLSVAVVAVGPRTLELIAVAPQSNHAFALRVRLRSPVTYGAGTRDLPWRRNAALALRTSGDLPWGPSALTPPSPAGMCDGIDASGLTICRAVQQQIAAILRGRPGI